MYHRLKRNPRDIQVDPECKTGNYVLKLPSVKPNDTKLKVKVYDNETYLESTQHKTKLAIKVSNITFYYFFKNLALNLRTAGNANRILYLKKM